ncbi:MAG: RHS repeat-associated core domain-containing protein [Ignavibacteriae bacterium]|nr:RHS repeat-associated core domain-containing protein [Ignavibacteriota bacterium]
MQFHQYVDGNWQKQYKFYDYLGSLRFTMKENGTLLNFKQYEAFGETTLDTLGVTRQGIQKLTIDNEKLTMNRQENIENYTIGNCQLSILNCQLLKYAAFGETTLDTLGVTRQGYIGKEKDVENNLGDHGVRKYDYETGRFNSIDPLWEKYFGWTPYQYCMNNPIWAKDWDGMKIFENASGDVLYNDNDESTKNDRYYVNEKVLKLATDKSGKTDWNILANRSNLLPDGKNWSDMNGSGIAALWTIGNIQFAETSEGEEFKFNISNITGKIDDNTFEMASYASVSGGIGKSLVSKLFNLNKGNWLRIGSGYHQGEEYLRIAWGAHKKHLKNVPEWLKPFNQWLRKQGGGHWDLWKK